MQTRTFTIALLSICALSGSALAQQATPAWYSGFETGFPGAPGEWLDYDLEAFSKDGKVNPGYSTAWTIATGGDVTYAGQGVYKGWPVAKQSESHRAYPVIHVDIPSPLVNSFMVYLDVDYNSMSETEWVHFATWSNNTVWDVHTLSVRDRKLEMAHLDWEYIGSGPQQDFPLRRWVRFTAYIHYQGDEGYVRLWQDGQPVLEGTYDVVAGRNLMRAHWGWYSSGSIAKGVQYNDEIQIWKLDAPLEDLENEPRSPYPQAGGGANSGGSGSGGRPAVSGSGGLAGARARGGASSSGSTTSSPGGTPGSAGRATTPTAGASSASPTEGSTRTVDRPSGSGIDRAGASSVKTSTSAGGAPSSAAAAPDGLAPQTREASNPSCSLSVNSKGASWAGVVLMLGALIPIGARRKGRA